MEVSVIAFEATKVAVLEHRGPPELLNDSVLRFIAWRKSSQLSPVKTSKTFGIAYDDPERTQPNAFRFDICGSVTEDVPPNPQGVLTKTIPGGRCAVVRHLGSRDRVAESIYPLYREWLPQSREALRDCPLFFDYVNLSPEVPDNALIMDIYLPLK